MKNETEIAMKIDAVDEVAYRCSLAATNKKSIEGLKQRYAEDLSRNPYAGFLAMRNDADYPFDHRIEMKHSDILDCYYSAFSRHLGEINSNDTNKIFVYCGDYAFEKNAMGEIRRIKVPYGDSRAEFRKYHDLEQYRPIYVSIGKCLDFESDTNNTIIFTNLDFYHLQRNFAMTMVQSDQSAAKARVLKLVEEEKKD